MSHEILNANPYAFIDDAPLEERRSRAVPLRRALPDDAESARLDPDVIEEVCEQAWPAPRDADELHDALLSLCVLPVEEAGEWSAWVDELLTRNRLAKAAWQAEGVEREGWVPAERMALIRAAIPGIRLTPEAIPFQGDEAQPPAQDEAALAIVRGWMEASGPVTAEELASRVGLALPDVNIALAALEGEGAVLRGRFARLAPEAEVEWCDRVLLARIHRMTLGKLRREIEPVTAADFIRYLLRWQHVHEDAMLHGRDGVLEVIRRLQGLELASARLGGADSPGAHQELRRSRSGGALPLRPRRVGTLATGRSARAARYSGEREPIQRDPEGAAFAPGPSGLSVERGGGAVPEATRNRRRVAG